MTIANDIHAFLTGRSPNAFCDDCISGALHLSQRQQAALRTETLGTTRDFTREQGMCSQCGEDRKVIHANRT